MHTSEGQITEQGFVELHELDAMDSFGEEADFWDSLVNLGYDRRLQLVKVAVAVMMMVMMMMMMMMMMTMTMMMTMMMINPGFTLRHRGLHRVWGCKSKC